MGLCTRPWTSTPWNQPVIDENTETISNEFAQTFYGKLKKVSKRQTLILQIKVTVTSECLISK